MSNFFKIAGLSQAHAQVVRDMEARTFATARVQSVAHFSAAAAGGLTHRVASNFAKRFIEPTMETAGEITESFSAQQGTAMGFAVQHVAPALAGIAAGVLVDAGVQAIGKFFINRGETTGLKQHITTGAVVVIKKDSPAYEAATREGNAFASIYGLDADAETKAPAAPSVAAPAAEATVSVTDAAAAQAKAG